MTPFAIDQNKRLIRVKPAQCRRADNIGSIGDRRLWKVETWHLFGEQTVGFGKARLAQ